MYLLLAYFLYVSPYYLVLKTYSPVMVISKPAVLRIIVTTGFVWWYIWFFVMIYYYHWFCVCNKLTMFSDYIS